MVMVVSTRGPCVSSTGRFTGPARADAPTHHAGIRVMQKECRVHVRFLDDLVGEPTEHIENGRSFVAPHPLSLAGHVKPDDNILGILAHVDQREESPLAPLLCGVSPLGPLHLTPTGFLPLCRACQRRWFHASEQLSE